MEGQWWERGVILGGWATAALLALFAFFSVIRSQGGDGDSPDQPAARVAAEAVPLRTPSSQVQDAVRTPRGAPERSPTPARTPRSIASQNAAATPTSRCDALRRSPNWQPSDREWFLANCLAGGLLQATTGSAVGATAPTPQPGIVNPPPESPDPAVPTSPPAAPTVTPVPPPPQDGSSLAISLAVQWLRNDAPVTFDAQPADCSAVSVGAAWVTTCNSRLAGCGDQPSCVRSIGLCVVLTPPTVTSARSC